MKIKFHAVFYKYFVLRFIFFLTLLLSIWIVRFPFIFKKIYGEDGALFISDALSNEFPLDLFKPAAGYSTLIMRLGGRFVSLFPLELSAIMCGLFSAFCLSLLAAGVLKYNNLSTQRFLPRLTLSLCFLFLPLASFSAIGNITNLYIYFMIASAVFLYYNEVSKSEAVFKSFVLFIAALSLPLVIFLIPILIHRNINHKKTIGGIRILKSELVFILGVLFQLAFIYFKAFGERIPNNPQSLFKVAYLFVERGIGTSLVPAWGFVSGNSEVFRYENAFFLWDSVATRLLTLFALAAMILLLFRNYKNHLSNTRNEQVFLLSLLSIIYSLLVGLFFNPEPRYMMFTSFLTCWIIILIFESRQNKKIDTSINFYLIFVLVLGLTASSHRSEGLEWKNELAKAEKKCIQMSPSDTIKIQTSPASAFWVFELSCKQLIQ
jgi:hypothetical protein